MNGELAAALLKSFVVGGCICVIGQLLFDAAKLTPAHTMSILVTAGALLGAFGIYDKLVDFAGEGAALPIVSFGNTLVTSAMEGAAESGFFGIWSQMLADVSTGIAAAVFFAFATALIFKPHG